MAFKRISRHGIGNLTNRRGGADHRAGQDNGDGPGVSVNTGDRQETGRPRLHCTVVLVGMMGCGKSAIGRTLAARLGVAFVDSDAEIETAANATIPEIFARDGEAFFRAREAEVIARLLRGEPCVLSTGGGAFLADRNRQAIAEHGVAIWLDADLDLPRRGDAQDALY